MLPLETLYRALPVHIYFIRSAHSEVIFTSLDIVWAYTIPKSLCLSPQATVFIIALAILKQHNYNAVNNAKSTQITLHQRFSYLKSNIP